MKKYIKPSFEEIEFEREDILTQSAMSVPQFVQSGTKVDSASANWDSNWDFNS